MSDMTPTQTARKALELDLQAPHLSTPKAEAEIYMEEWLDFSRQHMAELARAYLEAEEKLGKARRGLQHIAQFSSRHQDTCECEACLAKKCLTALDAKEPHE